MFTDIPMRKNISDLADRIDAAAGFHQVIQQSIGQCRHGKIMTMRRHPFKRARFRSHKRTGDYPGDLIRLYQFISKPAQVIQPFQAKTFFVAGNLQHTVRRSVDDGLSRTHMFFAQLLNDYRAAGMFLPQDTGQASLFNKCIHQFLRETVRLIREIAPVKIHRHTGNLPVPAQRIFALTHFFRPGIGSLDPTIIQNVFCLCFAGQRMSQCLTCTQAMCLFQSQASQIRQKQRSDLPLCRAGICCQPGGNMP